MAAGSGVVTSPLWLGRDSVNIAQIIGASAGLSLRRRPGWIREVYQPLLGFWDCMSASCQSRSIRL